MAINLHKAAVFAVVSFSAGAAQAGGYAVIDQSARAGAQAYAGAAVLAEDPTVMLFNPAGLALLSGTQITANFDYSARWGKFKNDGSRDAVGAPLRGGDGGKPPNAPIPSVYAMTSLTDTLKIGLGVNVPYGQKTEYDDGWQGRYFALKSELTTFGISPVVAWQATPWLSVGASANATYSKTTLTNAIDFGTICFAFAPPASCIGAGATPQNADGHLKLTGKDWSFGYTVGFIASPTETLHVGLSFKSAQTAKAQGRADFTVPASAAFLTASGLFTDTGIQAALPYPETIWAGASLDVTPTVRLYAGVDWVNWSKVQQVPVTFDNPVQPPQALAFNWHDTMLISGGAAWDVSEALTLRTGLAYDETPVPGSTRSPRLPGVDVWDVAAGATVRIADGWELDGAAQLIFFKKDKILLTDPLSGRLDGHYDFNAAVFSLQVTRRF